MENLNNNFIKDDNLIAEVESMSRTFIDPEVEKRGIEKGIEIGIEKGRDEGEIRTRYRFIVNDS